MTPLTTLISNFHEGCILSSLTTLTMIPTMTPSLVKASLKKILKEPLGLLTFEVSYSVAVGAHTGFFFLSPAANFEGWVFGATW